MEAVSVGEVALPGGSKGEGRVRRWLYRSEKVGNFGSGWFAISQVFDSGLR